MNAEYEPLNRPLQTGQAKFGPFDIAYALYSHGDVLKIIDHPHSAKKGLFLGDTWEHYPDHGSAFSEFLDGVISQGWGCTGNAEEQILQLSKMLPSEKDAPWAYEVPFSYVQFGNDGISLVHAGFIDPLPVKMGKQGVIEFLKGSFFYLNDFPTIGSPHYQPPHQLQLSEDELLFLMTDGVLFGTADKIGGQLALANLENILRENRQYSASVIRDEIIAGLGQYFIPETDKDDDASLVVVKRAR